MMGVTKKMQNARDYMVWSLGLCLSVAVFVVAGTFSASALSSDAPDNGDFGGAPTWLTLTNTRDVKDSGVMGIGIYRSGAKPTSNITVTINFQGGSLQGGNQNYQGKGAAKFKVDAAGESWHGPYEGDHASVKLTVDPNDWSLVPGGSGYSAHIRASLDPSRQSGDNSNHINFRLDAPSGYYIGPDRSDTIAVHKGSEYCSGGGRGCQTYTYSMPFAPDCDSNPGDSFVRIHDMDEGNSQVQPGKIDVDIINTTDGRIVNNNSSSGSRGNDGDADFHFNPDKNDKYAVRLRGVNANNILQIRLPFDSINAKINCNKPGQGTISQNGANCTQVRVTAYDPNEPNSNVSYQLQVGSGARSPKYTIGGRDGGSQVRDVSGLAGFSYWSANTVKLLVINNEGGSVSNPANVTLPQCARLSCGGTTFGSGVVNEDQNFSVRVTYTPTNAGTPPGSPKFTIKVTGPTASSGATFSNVAIGTASAGSISSRDVTFRPSVAGAYKVAYAFDDLSLADCDNDPAKNQAYQPFFTVLGGDAAAGPGFETASSCAPQTNAGIRGTNRDQTGTGPYYGASSQMGALALGNVTSFGTSIVNNETTGQALSAGASTAVLPHALSFANTKSGVTYGGAFNRTGWCSTNFISEAAKDRLTPLTNQTGNSIDIATLSPGGRSRNQWGTSETVRLSSPLTITASRALQLNTKLTMIVYGDVYINSDIDFQDGYNAADVTQIPQLKLLVSGTIYVSKDVGTLRGFYDAQPYGGTNGGKLFTCATSTAEIRDYTQCKKQLTVYGGVAARSLRLGRTLGSTSAAPGTPATPAERFIFTPELWLSDLQTVNNSSCTKPGAKRCTYDAFTSLPPVLQ